LKVLVVLLLLLHSIFASIVILTPDEKLFLENHPSITLGGGISFDPFLIQNPDGTVSGYDVDIAQLIKKKTGLEIKFKLDNWAKIQEESQKRIVDGISTTGKTAQRDKFYNYSYPYYTYSPIVIVNEGNPHSIHNKKDLRNKRVAVQRGNAIFTKIASSLDEVTIVYYKTMHELISGLVSKEVDFVILDETAFYLAKELGLEPFIELSFVIGEKRDLVFAIRDDYPELVSIINKGLSAISKPELLKIRDKWMKIGKVKELSRELKLTQEEQKYLKNKQVIKMCIDPSWPPYSELYKDEHIGISADINRLIAKQLPIPIQIVKTKNWTQSLEFVKQRKCDILDLAIQTPLREKYLNFTTPYVKVPLIIATRLDVTYIDRFDDLKDKILVIPKGYAFVELLKEKYSYLNIIETENIGDGLELVKEGKAFGYIGSLPSVAHAFKENFTGELKITGKFDFDIGMGSAVRNDDKTLFTIIQKVINSVPESEINHIVTKWINIKFESKTDYKLVGYILLIGIFIILIGLYYYKKLYKMNQKLLSLEEELLKQAHIDPLTGLFNRRHFIELAKSIMKLALRNNSDTSVLMLDIDKFKNINDLYGHHVGDDVLTAFSLVLQKSGRKSDIICRWGGEEFVILLPETCKEKAFYLAEKIRKTIERTTVDIEKNKPLNFTVSIGISHIDIINDKSIDNAIDRADKALYKAKESGRNKVY